MNSTSPRLTSHSAQKPLALLSIAAFSALIFGYLWWGRFQYFHQWYLAATLIGAVALVVANHWYFGDSRAELGLRLDNLAQALGQVLLATVLLAAVLLIPALWKGEYRLERWGDLLIYLPWGLVQQHGLQNFLFLGFRRLLPEPGAALACAALLFSLFHLPNLILVGLTLLGGVIWCWLFYRVPNLFAVALSHALLAGVVLLFFKFGVADQFQVGLPGQRYEAFGDGVLVAAGYDASGEIFIATLPGHDRKTPSLLRLFRPGGKLLAEWTAFPEHDFSGNLAVGELGYEPGDEIVVVPGPGPGNPPLVRIFSGKGDQLLEFRAETRQGYGAGVSIADGRILVTTGPAPASPAEVLEYGSQGKLIRRWSFQDTPFQNGVQALLLTSEDHSGPQPEKVLALWGTPIASNPSQVLVYDTSGKPLDQWDIYGTTYGLRVSRIHLEEETTGLVTSPGPLRGYPPNLQVFDRWGGQLYNLLAYEDPAACGCNLGSIDLDGDGRDEVVLGEGICPGRRPTVRIIDLSGNLLHQWDAY